MVRVGAVLFVVGVLFTAVTLSSLITGVAMPSIMWSLSMLMGVGFLFILFGLLGSARSRSVAIRDRA